MVVHCLLENIKKKLCVLSHMSYSVVFWRETNSAELLLPRNQFEVATLKWHMVCSKFFQVCLSRFISFFLTFTILIHFYLFKVERLLIHDKTMTTKLMLSCLDIKKLSKRLSNRHLQRKLLITKIERWKIQPWNSKKIY